MLIIIILAITFSVVFMRIVFDLCSAKIRMSDIVIFILCALCLYYVSTATKSYDKGFNDAIHSAEIIDSYHISFNGEVHEYN